MRTTLLLSFLFLPFVISAQVKFETGMSTSANDIAWCVIQDSSDNFVYTGWTNSRYNDILVTKTNPSGGLIWTKTYFSGNGETTEDIATTEDGYILGGSYIDASNNDYDFLLTRIDTAGNIIWSKRYHGSAGITETGVSVIQTSDGGFLLGGLYRFSSSSITYPTMLKTDSLGNLEWYRYVFMGNDAQLGEVIELPGKRYVGVGAMYLGGSNQVSVFCIDSTGSTVWHHLYGGVDYEYASNISYDTTDQTMVIGGSTTSYGQGEDDYVIFKTDSAGNVLWSTIIGNNYSEIMNDIEPAWDGGYIFTGNTQYFTFGSEDMVIGKLDSLGNLQWMKSKPGSSIGDDTRHIVQCHDNGYLLTGNYNTTEILSAKFDYLGNTCSAWTTMTPSVIHTVLPFTSPVTALAMPSITVTNHTMATESTLTITPTCTTCQNFSVTATSNSPACIGGNLNLSSSGAVNTLWQGPSFSSTSASPVITNVTPSNTGTYYLYADDGAGCYAALTLEVLVDNCLEIADAAAENETSIYPNPSGGIFTLSFSENFPAGTSAVEITDIGGKLIYYNQNFTGNTLTIDLSQAEAGMYFVNVKSGDVVYHGKLIRQ